MRLLPALLAILVATALGGCERRAPGIDKDYPLTRLTERVYVIQGPNEAPTPANQAFINNPAFVLTQRGVVVIDPGSSLQVGELLLKKIATVTREPVVAVFDTHVHGDHWLGNDAIRRRFTHAVLYAHPKMIEAAARTGSYWVGVMNHLTDNAVRGTRPVVPDLGVEDDETVALGGVHFHVLHPERAHTDGDLMIEVVEDRVLFTGDIVMNRRAGRMDDGNFRGNIAACEVALKVGARQVVPGHGPVGDRAVIVAYRDWLTALYGSVQRHRSRGLKDFEMKDQVVADLKAYRDWARFDAEIGKLISLAYLQSEQESF